MEDNTPNTCINFLLTMKWVLFICFAFVQYICNSQAFYKTGNPILDGWSLSLNAIRDTTTTQSTGYSESNTSPQSSGETNLVFRDCSPGTYTTTSPIISSSGKQNIVIGFGVRRTGGFNIPIIFEYFNGSSWIQISNSLSSVTPANNWNVAFFNLPSGADNNPSLRFRFTFTTTSNNTCFGNTPSTLKIDDFWVGANFKLPIQLSSFDISRQNGKPNITWASLSEQNNHYYSLERSSDNKTFTEIKRVSGFGPGTTDKKAEYFHTDQRPVPGINYYRLRQVDLDGTETIYPVKSIFIAPEKTMVFPTMFNSSISILFTDPPSPNDKWQLINTNGQLITRGQFSDKNVQQEIHFGDLVSGVYSFLINGKEGKQVFKLIKN